MFSGAYQIAWPFFFASIVAFGLVVSARNKTKSTASTYFTLTMVAAGMWSLFSGLHLTAGNMAAKMFFADAKFLFITTLPVFWLLLAWSFSNKRDTLKPATAVLLFLFPVITIILVATNGSHHLVFDEVTPFVTERFVSFSRSYGPWFWMHTVYSYSLIIIGVGIFMHSIVFSKGHLRAQAMVMSGGSVTPLLFNAIFLSNPDAFLYLDFTPVAFAATGVVYFYGLFKFKMLDLMPMAQAEIVRSMEDAVIVTDPSGIVLDANLAGASLRATSIGSEVGQPVLHEFPFLTDAWNASLNSRRYSQEIPYLIDSDQRWYRADFKRIITSSGKHEGQLIVLRDITDSKQTQMLLQDAKMKAEELSQLKSAFLSDMSHDVRTPLAGIIGMAGLLVEECHGDQKEFALMIKQSGHRLLKQLNSLLSVSHLSDGKLDINSEILDVTALSSRVIAGFGTEFDEKQIQLQVSLPSEPLRAKLDSEHLVHALSHILNHTVRSTDEGGVHFDLRKELGEAVFRISYDGCSDEADIVRSITEPHTQTLLTESGMEPGCGLGLRVANGLIEELGGSLSFKTEMGIGSFFTIRVPVVDTGKDEQPSVPMMADRNPLAQAKMRASASSQVLRSPK